MNNEILFGKISQVEGETREALQEQRAYISHLRAEVERLERIMETAIATAVHELIDYLRHDDIQSLDEEEFFIKIRDLLWDESTALPF